MVDRQLKTATLQKMASFLEDMEKHFQEMLSESKGFDGFTLAHWTVLHRTWRAGGRLSQTEAKRSLAHIAGYTSDGKQRETIKQLVKWRFVRKEHDEDDERRTWVILTDTGTERVERYIEESLVSLCRTYKTLNREELERLRGAA